MFNFLASCGLCSNQPQPGDYAYELFDKVPSVATNNFTGGQGNIIQNTNWEGQDPYKFINNLPKKSVIMGEYTFQDLINKNPKDVYIRKIMKSNYADLLTQYQERGQNFIDREFPPEQSSIGEVEDLRVRATWKRIPDIIKDPIFISSHIQPKDVFQGSLGDCYFLSAISALAQKDYRIKNLFPDLTLNRHGIYMARILYKGVLREVIVDDYIPVNQQGDPLFAKASAGREIWIMILEKCWAKLHGSYGAIVGGLPNEVLHSFSGAPTYYYQISNNKEKQEQLWPILLQANLKGALLCCSSKSQEQVQHYGLTRGHAYTILNLYQHPYRMLKLRNPQTGHQWQGRAGSTDWQFWASISPTDRQQLGKTQKKTDTFFILWQDFVNSFNIIDICKINDNANYSNCQCFFDRKRAEMLQFQTTGGSLTLTLTQTGLSKGKGSLVQHKNYGRSLVIVAKKQEATNGYEYKYTCSSTNNLYEQNVQLNELPAGKYVIYAKFNWQSWNPQIANVSLYSQSPIHLATSSQSHHKNFLYKVFLDHARNNTKKQSIGPGEWICNDLLLTECGYGYLAFHLGDKSTRKLGIQIFQNQYTQKRFVLKKPYRGRGVIKTSIEPGNELIVLFHIKSQNLPHSATLPTPKIYNLI